MAFAALQKVWITAISGRQAHPSNPIGTNGNGCATSLLLKRNPTSAGLAIIANIEKVITKL
jgi:hypothetical protein